MTVQGKVAGMDPDPAGYLHARGLCWYRGEIREGLKVEKQWRVTKTESKIYLSLPSPPLTAVSV
jgi:hypothetical protein